MYPKIRNVFFDFVNDGRHVTLSATEVPSQNILGEFELNMSGLEEFDLSSRRQSTNTLALR